MEGIDHDIPENDIFEIEIIVQNLGWYTNKSQDLVSRFNFQECHFKVYYGLFLHEIEYLFRSASICVPSEVLYQDSIFKNIILSILWSIPSLV